MFNTFKIGKLEMACCPECHQWYERNTMVVVNPGLSTQKEVCVDCYEEKYFVPPKGFKEGSK